VKFSLRRRLSSPLSWDGAVFAPGMCPPAIAQDGGNLLLRDAEPKPCCIPMRPDPGAPVVDGIGAHVPLNDASITLSCRGQNIFVNSG